MAVVIDARAIRGGGDDDGGTGRRVGRVRGEAVMGGMDEGERSEHRDSNTRGRNGDGEGYGDGWMDGGRTHDLS